MPRKNRDDFSERRRAKQISRARDESDLREGVVSRDELRTANGLFSSLDVAASTIRRRRTIAP